MFIYILKAKIKTNKKTKQNGLFKYLEINGMIEELKFFKSWNSENRVYLGEWLLVKAGCRRERLASLIKKDFDAFLNRLIIWGKEKSLKHFIYSLLFFFFF